MTSTQGRDSGDRTLAAAGLILIYSLIIGYTDNHVRTIAESAGLWQFHATRSAMALVLLALAAPVLGLRLRPKRPLRVLARSLIHGAGMVIYFGALAFLDVSLVAAGLFTAPIWVLLIGRVIYGRAVAWVQIAAVAAGFTGVILVLGPAAMGGASIAAGLPVLGGMLYALGNIATRDWCAGETAETLLGGFFAALGGIGAVAMLALALWPMANVPPGAEGFLQRGPVWPDASFYLWTFAQAAGSLVGVGMMIRAYQLADAGRVAVLEYMILPSTALWTWILWQKGLELQAIIGMGLIAAAGSLIALSSDKNAPGGARAGE